MSLKKTAIIWFMLAMLIQLPKAYSQENRFAAGIEMGPSYLNFYGNPALKENKKINIGFYSGWSFQYNINNTLSLRTGFASELKGHSKEFPSTDLNGMPTGFATAKARYSYLTVPLMVRATFGQKFKYFLNLGAFAGYALKQKSILVNPPQPDWETDDSGSMKAYDYGITAGAGLGYPVSNNLELSLEVRNNLGLVNLSEVPVIQNGSIKTNSLNLLFGLSYKFGETDQPAN